MDPTAIPAPEPEGLPTAPALEAERDALRVQAAAVVAQQAALGEEELRLLQRRDGLEHQEEQLANHLDEKRRLLLELREQVKAEREALKTERADQERKLAARHKEAEAAFAESDAERKESLKERARFFELRKRLQSRWDEHFKVHKAELQRRAQELGTAEQRLAGERAKLEQERAALIAQRLQHNGAMELGRRQLDAERAELSASQQEWEACLNQEKREYEQRARELADRERDVEHWEHALAADKRAWEHVQAERAQETEGLEARIRNQRLKLQALEQAAAKHEAAAPSFPLLSPERVPETPVAERTAAPVALKRLAGCLADQRLHLLEQWRGVLQLQDNWREQRESVLTEMEESSRRLDERARLVAEREQQSTAWAGQLEQRAEVLAQLRCNLEGRQARLTASLQEWETERARVLAEALASEESANARVQHLVKLCRRTFKRRRADAAAWEEARTRCEATRKKYAELCAESRQRTETLLREQQALAGDTLALERLRLEILGKTENVAAAEKRLDKLRRQSQTLVNRAEAELERERAALDAEAVRLEERGETVRQGEEHIVAWRAKLAKRQANAERRRSEIQKAEQQWQQETQRLLTQHEQDTKHLQELRDEVERIARVLIEEVGNVGKPHSPLAA